MKKLLMVLVVLLAGCATDSSWTKVTDKQIQVQDRVFRVLEYDPCPDIFRTDDIEYICLTWGTYYRNCTVMDIQPRMKAKYSSSSFDYLHTTDGFTIFVRYVDDITILEK